MEFKTGDRVRVTLEGEVHLMPSQRGQATPAVWVRSDALGADALVYASAIEKLQDPEPQWVNGDVVRYFEPDSTAELIVRSGDRWHWASDNMVTGLEISAAWAYGRIEILHKADAEKAS